jgi:hypothetical protein
MVASNITAILLNGLFKALKLDDNNQMIKINQK